MVEQGRVREIPDVLATEEPLEIRVMAGRRRRTTTITMRTPGADFELAAGLLHGEQVIRDADDIRRMTYCVDRSVDEAQRYNIINVELRRDMPLDQRLADRSGIMTSACGVCGKASIEALHLHGCPTIPPGPRVSAATIGTLPDTLRREQGLFAATGGIHAAALFDTTGQLLVLREDVGRHNAVDKAVGWALLGRRLPLHDCVLLVSGRTSYEILQKALVAGIPIVCAISAPSSLAVALAEEFGITLAGFVRDGRFNVYTGIERIDIDTTAAV